MIVVDASVWVGSIVESDVYYRTSDAWLHDWFVSGHQVYAPGILLPEVGGSISRRTMDQEMGYLALESLLLNQSVHIVQIDAELAELSARFAIQCSLRGADAVYVAVSSKLQIPLLTWDRELLKRASEVIETLHPSMPPNGVT